MQEPRSTLDALIQAADSALSAADRAGAVACAAPPDPAGAASVR